MNIKEYVSGKYLKRTSKRFYKYFPNTKYELTDENTKWRKCYPRWHLTIHFKNTEEYEHFWEIYKKIFPYTLFPNAVKDNGCIIMYVKNHKGYKEFRYIL